MKLLKNKFYFALLTVAFRQCYNTQIYQSLKVNNQRLHKSHRWRLSHISLRTRPQTVGLLARSTVAQLKFRPGVDHEALSKETESTEALDAVREAMWSRCDVECEGSSSDRISRHNILRLLISV